jgi:hypothetical protein
MKYALKCNCGSEDFECEIDNRGEYKYVCNVCGNENDTMQDCNGIYLQVQGDDK